MLPNTQSTFMAHKDRLHSQNLEMSSDLNNFTQDFDVMNKKQTTIKGLNYNLKDVQMLQNNELKPS